MVASPDGVTENGGLFSGSLSHIEQKMSETCASLSKPSYEGSERDYPRTGQFQEGPLGFIPLFPTTLS